MLFQRSLLFFECGLDFRHIHIRRGVSIRCFSYFVSTTGSCTIALGACLDGRELPAHRCQLVSRVFERVLEVSMLLLRQHECLFYFSALLAFFSRLCSCLAVLFCHRNGVGSHVLHILRGVRRFRSRQERAQDGGERFFRLLLELPKRLVRRRRTFERAVAFLRHVFALDVVRIVLQQRQEGVVLVHLHVSTGLRKAALHGKHLQVFVQLHPPPFHSHGEPLSRFCASFRAFQMPFQVLHFGPALGQLGGQLLVLQLQHLHGVLLCAASLPGRLDVCAQTSKLRCKCSCTSTKTAMPTDVDRGGESTAPRLAREPTRTRDPCRRILRGQRGQTEIGNGSILHGPREDACRVPSIPLRGEVPKRGAAFPDGDGEKGSLFRRVRRWTTRRR
mmetsp:Transcript_6797/g.41484  ORF Transcript_6797/g.41484 Transcript_6797/m.41484 type:complete len:389 (-) Transcript_6797:333-1499(-)